MKDNYSQLIFDVKAKFSSQQYSCCESVAIERRAAHELGMKLHLGKILAERGMRQHQLAELLDVSNGYISQLVNGKRQPSPEILSKMSEVLGVSPGRLLAAAQPVAVAGRIGAGQAVDLVDEFAKGDGLFHIAAPDDLVSSGIVAVEVVGESMSPLIEEGDVVLFTRNFFGIDPDVIGRVGICQTDDGRALVKQIRLGREEGTFDLYSINPVNPPEYGVRLVWAAPWRRILRKQDVETVAV